MMRKPKRKLMRALATTVLILALTGCVGKIKHHYPTWPAPERPAFAFASEGDHCLGDAELRTLNKYVIKLEALVTKYECEIQIINGGKCARRTK